MRRPARRTTKLQIQCADLVAWNGDLTTPGWRKVVGIVAELLAASSPPEFRGEIDASAGPGVQPRPRAMGNLPTHASSFVGREAEVIELVELLHTHRLAFLTEVGGVGKTRLAVRVAAQLPAEFPDGVWTLGHVERPQRRDVWRRSRSAADTHAAGACDTLGAEGNDVV